MSDKDDDAKVSGIGARRAASEAQIRSMSPLESEGSSTSKTERSTVIDTVNVGVDSHPLSSPSKSERTLLPRMQSLFAPPKQSATTSPSLTHRIRALTVDIEDDTTEHDQDLMDYYGSVRTVEKMTSVDPIYMTYDMAESRLTSPKMERRNTFADSSSAAAAAAASASGSSSSSSAAKSSSSSSSASGVKMRFPARGMSYHSRPVSSSLIKPSPFDSRSQSAATAASMTGRSGFGARFKRSMLFGSSKDGNSVGIGKKSSKQPSDDVYTSSKDRDYQALLSDHESEERDLQKKKKQKDDDNKEGPPLSPVMSLNIGDENSMNEAAAIESSSSFFTSSEMKKKSMSSGSIFKMPDSNNLTRAHVIADLNHLIWQRSYFLLVLVGCMIALVAWLVSYLANHAWHLQSWMSSNTMIGGRGAFNNPYTYIGFILLILTRVLFVVLAIWVTGFRPASAGSGVPQLKAIISGIWIREYLGLSTFFVKITALSLSLSTGLPIGLEGPFIHLGAILARQMCKISVFRHLDRKQVLSAACAGGLSAAFGAPLGGVLFSIEVTSTYYGVTGYWTAFCCAVAGSTLTHVLTTLSPTSLLLFQTTFASETDKDQFKNVELFAFAMLALIMGCFGLCFIIGHEWYIRARRNYQEKLLGNSPYTIAIVTCVLFTIVCFFVGDFAVNPARKTVSDLFTVVDLDTCTRHNNDNNDDNSQTTLQESWDWMMNSLDHHRRLLVNDGSDEETAHDCNYHDWGRTNQRIQLNLFLFALLSFVFTIASVTLAFPVGVFAPVFTIGSVLGRLYGEILRQNMDVSGSVAVLDPRVYSVVGAAAASAAVTGTISPAVITLEITSELNLSVPVLLAVIIACGLTRYFKGSFYDSVLKLRGIPLLPITPSHLYKRIIITDNENGDRNHKTSQSGGPRSGSKDADQLTEKLINDEEQQQQQQQRGQQQKANDIEDGNQTNKMDPTIMERESYKLLSADDAMISNVRYVIVKPDPVELAELLVECRDLHWFAIVKDHSERVFIGEVRHAVLMDYLRFVAPGVYQTRIPTDMRDMHISTDYELSYVNDKDIQLSIGDALRQEEMRQTISREKERKRRNIRRRRKRKRSASISVASMDSSIIINARTLLKTKKKRQLQSKRKKRSSLANLFSPLRGSSDDDSANDDSDNYDGQFMDGDPHGYDHFSSDNEAIHNELNATNSDVSELSANSGMNLEDEVSGLAHTVALDDIETQKVKRQQRRQTSLMESPFIERLNLAPIAVISGMPLLKVYTMFHILKPHNIYVTRYSILVGVLTETALLRREEEWSGMDQQEVRDYFSVLFRCGFCARSSPSSSS